ncbi:MAG: adenosine deaminase [Actinomycetaceae bacterium]|nr:adenosine deaminase [Actinomycetaceae bacterium]
MTSTHALRSLRTLPKAHLHLHFTGAMRPQTLLELAEKAGLRLPTFMLEGDPLRVPADQRGWFRFQRSYDVARSLVRCEGVMRRLIDEAVEDDAQEGSQRLEIQVDPTSYAPWVGGITPALEIILDQAKLSSAAYGVEVGVIVAASRMKHPLDARTLARLAARHAGVGPGEVVGFGLSNDERNGQTSQWAQAFRIARQAGLAAVPHGGELLGPEHVAEVVAHLKPTRLGHGVRLAEDPRLLDMVIEAGICLELCPSSNVSLGVYPELSAVPLPTLVERGATIALGADDPLLFRSRLLDQYQVARDVFGFNDATLASLARSSIKASLASGESKKRMLQGVDSWLQHEPGTATLQ